MLSDHELREMYEDQKMSTRSIAKALGVNISATRKALLQAGVKMRSIAESTKLLSEERSRRLLGTKRGPYSEEARARMSKSARARWDGKARGVSLKPSGYLEFTTGENKGRRVHVVVIERRIGRRLAKGENVHHVDGNKTNNNADNLQLMTASEHARLHRLMEREKGGRPRNEMGQFTKQEQVTC